jgi:pyruvate/2-oxoglutarate dehydrogenase complex dihydrolipoamide acyltransferase (E2) component
MTEFETRGGRLTMPRSRGAASGLLLVVLGIYGALIPFIGPYFDFSFSPDQAWLWTTARGWLEVLPGAVTAVGGLLLLMSRNRASAMLGGWLAVLGGAWFVIGRALAGPLGLGDVGAPVAFTDAKRVTLELAYFSGLGALIILLAAMALGRLSVRSVRDVAYARRPLAHEATAATAAPAEPAMAAPATHMAAPTESAEPTTPTTTMPPTSTTRVPAAPRRRRWGGLLGGRHTPAH